MVADVVGYSRMMEQDEAGTLAALKERRKAILEPVVKEHGGRIVKVMGDGALVEFGSAVNAVQGAIELQKQMAVANEGVSDERRIVLRIGINLGDVIGEGGDIYGEGVNIAARLEPLAEPGGVIISGAVYEQVLGKIDMHFEDLGDQRLKNIDRSVHAYRSGLGAATGKPTLALPDKPSIAVLPFQNMSGDPEQEYFADGMVDEITMALSRLRWLFVIARNSSFTYKGRAVDVRQVGRELGVRYVLEGSVRKAGNRVRIAGELIDASTGTQLWSDRFEGGLEDIFDLQDLITASVVGALAPRLESAEIERAMRKPTGSLSAYDYYMRGMGTYNQWKREASIEALRLFKRAIELDPKFASANAMAARCYVQRKAGGWVTDRNHEIAETARLARRAAELGKDDSVALGTAGFALAWVVGAVEEGATLVERALALNPNFAWGWGFSGWINVWLGKPDVAAQHLARALRLSPHDPLSLTYQTAAACAHFFNGQYGAAWTWAETAMHDRPDYAFPNCIGAASGALAGKLTEAERAVTRLRSLMPDLRVSNLIEFFPLRRPRDLAMFAEALRKAGLPE
ncbi:MAG: adenylate/guanylate cyclase domain-containing protein [Rhizobiales bacterium]|nr:adenylate/guanylate cyclase domain-containing protein [Hyphomicrobiales bacterium]